MTNKILISLVILLFLIKISAVYFTGFDLFGDEAQYWLWSKDIDFGYFSKPPLLAWVIKIYSQFFGETFLSLKILPMLIYFLTACVVYNLCKNIGLNKKNSLSCSLLFLFIPSVSFSSYIISTDIVLLLFWTLSLNELVKIKKNPNTINFISLGIFLGLAFLAKYAAIYFVICLLTFIFADKKFRIFFLKNFYLFFISLLCALLILLPNIIWNLNNGWITLQHTSDNVNLENAKFSLYRGLEFILVQILMLGPFIFLGTIINYKKINIIDNEIKLLLFFSLPIFLIVFIEAILVRANANWAAPGLISFFVFLYIVSINNILKKMNILFNFTFCVFLYLLIGSSYPAKIFDRVNGLNTFAQKIYSIGANDENKNFVISDRLLFSSMSYELRDKNLSFYMPYNNGSVVTNHFMITSSLKKDMAEDFILIGNPNEIEYLNNNFTIIKITTPDYIFTSKDLNIYEVSFN